MHPFFSRLSLVGLAASAFIPGLLMALHMPIAGAVTLANTLPEIQHLFKQGQLPQALEKVDNYLSVQPKDAPGRFLKGVILTGMGRPADAIGVFNKLTEDFPTLPEPYNNLAVLYAQQKQYDKARIALEMAIKTHPSYSVAHENLGDIYARLASQSYDRALQRDSTQVATQPPLSLIHELGTSAAKPNPATLPNPNSNSTSTASSPAQTAAKSAAGKVAALDTAQTSPKVGATHAPQGHSVPVLLDSRAGGDTDVAKIFQHWSNAWSGMDSTAAIGYFISDLTCRIMREKINAPGLSTGTTGSSGIAGCRSERRKSRFW